MNVDQIKNLDELIKLEPGQKIKNHKVKRLTAPGENYGSLMLSLDIFLETSDGPTEINAVAKMVPPNDFIQEVFKTQVTFRNEISFYKKIVPLLQNFQKEHGVDKVIDFAAKYYGSRLNLNNDDSKVDSDGVIVLENLNHSGYTNLNRLEGLGLDAAEQVLKNLAQLHAVPLALKLQKPEVFEKSIKPHLTDFKGTPASLEKMKKDQMRLIEQTEELQGLKDRILKGCERFFLEEVPPREKYFTIIHNDCWTNNNMFKVENGRVVGNKIVDQQVLIYGSFVRDVVFFIFSSVKNDVVREKYDYMLKFYHKHFISILIDLHCDVRDYSFDAFLEEINIEAKFSEFAHLNFLLLPIYAPKGSVKEISELTPDDFGFQDITDLQKEKFIFVYKEFARRKWI